VKKAIGGTYIVVATSENTYRGTTTRSIDLLATAMMGTKRAILRKTKCQPMNQKPFDLTLIKFEDHDPPSACERSFEHRRHLSSPMKLNLPAQFTSKVSAQSEPSTKTGCKGVELLHRRLRRERQFRGGVAESVHLSVGRGCRREKLPWVSREHTDVNSSITGCVERVDVLVSLRPSVFKKND